MKKIILLYRFLLITTLSFPSCYEGRLEIIGSGETTDEETGEPGNEPPVADAGEDIEAAAGEEVLFDGSGSYDPDGEISSFLWSFPDGVEEEGASVTRSFESPGIFEVVLTVKDDGGLSSRDGLTLTVVENLPPVAVIDAPSQGGFTEILSFDSSSSFDPDGEIILSQWDFGDGTAEVNGTTIDRAFPHPGEFRVTLTVFDDRGAQGESSIDLTISPLPEKEWTFAVFLNGDNDLEDAGIEDMNEMEVIGSTEEVNVVVLFDRARGYDTTNGDWTTARYYYITQDDMRRNISSVLIQDIGEIDMGDWEVLKDFFIHVHDNFPARKFALDIWNHGSGWDRSGNTVLPLLKGISDDDSSGNKISIAEGELENALSEITSYTGEKIDLIGYDACLMQMWEVQYIAAPYALFQVGSEANEDWDGWDYEGILSLLTQDPSMDGGELGDAIAYTFHLTGDSTQSVIDLGAGEELNGKIDSFALYIVENMETLSPALLEAMRDTIDFSWPSGYLDLGDLLDEFSTRYEGEEVRGRVDSLTETLDMAVYSSYTSRYYSEARGLSIYMPLRSFDPTYISGSGARWSQETNWDDLLLSLLSL